MEFDFSKIGFNEIDTDGALQAFYYLKLTQCEMNEWFNHETSGGEIPEGVTIKTVELCLTVFSRQDFKLEAVCSADNGEQYWVTLDQFLYDAQKWVQMIPDYETLVS